MAVVTDDVFRALADPGRRALLDALFQRDGQTLTELCAVLDMSRFGTMKHLGVLERAGLVVTRRVGRTKLHYLNPVPIRLVHDRWTTKYAERFTAALSDLKRNLEDSMATRAPTHVYEVYIRTTPEALWRAITDPDFTRKYFYGTAVSSEFEVGSPIRYLDEGEPMLDGEILEIDPQRRLVTTFMMLHDEEAKRDKPSRVTWTIEPRGDVCKLTLVHAFESETRTYHLTGPGWNPVLSGLKTLLETGKPLVIGEASSASE